MCTFTCAVTKNRRLWLETDKGKVFEKNQNIDIRRICRMSKQRTLTREFCKSVFTVIETAVLCQVKNIYVHSLACILMFVVCFFPSVVLKCQPTAIIHTRVFLCVSIEIHAAYIFACFLRTQKTAICSYGVCVSVWLNERVLLFKNYNIVGWNNNTAQRKFSHFWNCIEHRCVYSTVFVPRAAIIEFSLNAHNFRIFVSSVDVDFNVLALCCHSYLRPFSRIIVFIKSVCLFTFFRFSILFEKLNIYFSSVFQRTKRTKKKTLNCFFFKKKGVGELLDEAEWTAK